MAAVPSGTVVGISTVHGAAQAFARMGSFHVAKLSPQVGYAPAVPPKFTVPFVAVSKSGIAFAPLSTMVGKVKFHHLNPVIAAPVKGSEPFGVLLEM